MTSDWLNIFTKAFGVHTWCTLYALTMETVPMKRVLSNDAEAIRKRNNRTALREKRREDSFVNGYVQVKYPEVYMEIKTVYESFKDSYPGRYDLTKTYYYKKWEKETRKKTSTASSTAATSTVSSASTPIVASTASSTAPTSSGQKHKLYLPYLPILSNMCENAHELIETIEEGQQPQEETQEEIQQPLEETHQQENVCLGTSLNNMEIGAEEIISGMTLSEMEMSVEEIVKALQSDNELMDIVENFDLPDAVWNNELAIPDYILEDGLEW